MRPSRPAPTRCALALAASLLAVLAACGGAASRRPNVLLVVADTLRADKLGCYGHDGGLTPYIDRLAEESVLFERATSHAPWTLPSTASLLTSLYPAQHGAGGRLGNFTGLHPSVETLAERFARAGYATHAIVNVTFLGEKFGLTRGFDEVDARAFNNNIEVRSAEETTDAALSWIDGPPRRAARSPFFLMVHYFDVHAVYAPPQPFRGQFAAPPDREDESFVFGTRAHMMALRAGALELEPQVIRRAEKLYDAEIAYMDSQIGRLIDGVEERGIAGDTIVVFTTDHGEEFLDHGGFEHGHTLYAELTDVPLLVRVPGATPGRRTDSVGHIDVAPTLCELVGIEPSPEYMGASLVGALAGRPLADRPLLAHGDFWEAPLSSARVGDYKLIVPADPAEGAPELYRWRVDPREQEDLSAAEPGIVERLAALIEELERRASSAGPGVRVELSEEDLEALEGLGYGGGAAEDD